MKPKTHRLSCKKPPPTGCPPPSNRPAGRSHCPDQPDDSSLHPRPGRSHPRPAGHGGHLQAPEPVGLLLLPDFAPVGLLLLPVHHRSQLPRRERQRSGIPETEFLTAEAGIRHHLPSRNPPPRPARDHRPYHFRRGLGLAARSGRRSAWPGQCGVLQREFGIKFGFWFGGWDIIWCKQYHFVTCN
ncbi:hypothetical protein FH972_015594 [Carpinus fangiana]|uniref:Uncharacterized protein n=1 Tax=Carpinus fangiana TaxID=176857 RepID=A0A5N6RGL7_9ROSI|nr:hypothetical protein FH972_015594 [Carpinus fangiana]